MLNLLDIVPGTGNNSGNYVFTDFGEALLYALVGFLIVFLGIAVIIFIIWLIGLLMKKTNNLAFLSKKKEDKTAAQPAPAVADNAEEDIPDEIKVAVVAAVMAYCQAEKPKCEFKVKRIKRL